MKGKKECAFDFIRILIPFTLMISLRFDDLISILDIR
jgi:hypothetical protein